MHNRGRFITFEGTEGVGKSTQLENAANTLKDLGVDFIVTREPGGTPMAENIRELLLSPREEPVHETTELLLMFAARVQHLHNRILPALDKGQWVLCDRFTDATFAYQGGGRGIDRNRIETISDWTLKGLETDLTLLFDLPVAVGQSRVIKRQQEKDRFEQEKAAFFEKIRDCYLQRAEAEPQRIKCIDASRDIEAIQSQLSEILTELLST